MIRRQSWRLATLTILFGAHVLAAQGSSQVGLKEISRHATIATPIVAGQATQWKKGMIIGGAIGVLLDVLIVTDPPCNGGGDCKARVAPLLGVVLVFGLIGGLIGSGFKKH